MKMFLYTHADNGPLDVSLAPDASYVQQYPGATFVREVELDGLSPDDCEALEAFKVLGHGHLLETLALSIWKAACGS